jgi:hypothetical protein
MSVPPQNTAFLYKAGVYTCFNREAELAEAVARQISQFEGQSDEVSRRIFENAPHTIALALDRLKASRPGNGNTSAAEAMAYEALLNFAERISADSLLQFREASLAPGSFFLPRYVFHVLAGNLFVSGYESITHALLCGGCCMVRCSSREQSRTVAFLEALGNDSSLIQQALVAGWWPAVWQSVTRAAAAQASAVIVFGNDESVSRLRDLSPATARFIGHGNKASFAVVSEEDLNSRQIARDLAYDFTVYDQHGCLSPRAAFLQTKNPQLAFEFAALLDEEMHEIAKRLPRSPLTLEEAVAMARARDNLLLRHPEARILAPGKVQSHHVSIANANPYQPGSTNRFCDLRTFAELNDLIRALEPYSGQISTIGASRELVIAQELQQILRVPRLCAIGSMQRPPLGWTHDGRLPLRDLVEYYSIEKS